MQHSILQLIALYSQGRVVIITSRTLAPRTNVRFIQERVSCLIGHALVLRCVRDNGGGRLRLHIFRQRLGRDKYSSWTHCIRNHRRIVFLHDYRAESARCVSPFHVGDGVLPVMLRHHFHNAFTHNELCSNSICLTCGRSGTKQTFKLLKKELLPLRGSL